MTKKLSFPTAVFAGILFFASCVPTNKFNAVQQALASARYDSAQLANKVKDLQSNMSLSQKQAAQKIDSLNQVIAGLNQQIAGLNGKIGDLQTDATNRNALLSKNQKDLLDQQAKLERLQALMDKQKAAIEEIRKKMTKALVGFKSNELTVSIKNGKVYVSLQENLLFPSGSAVVNPKGKDALGKLAAVLNQNTDITVDIEGHTDSIPIHAKFQDNWDLSLARSASIVRILTTDYSVDPTRVIASGHSQYDPVQPNSTPEGRAQNRRTDIILSPKLDELYRLLQTPGV
ncbi:OmpA family protein [Puia dinghuensis]|uniref:Flagellar motor protein MotB n=1 Tax=Puia dinghuensis TaxID=1792502 RepID=A0A8J2XSB0_9BACT|nr:OmpA family protein [Puia dinghuensis]GGA90362.1 flagellar motor protein MotB [Puia dinghuensis]